MVSSRSVNEPLISVTHILAEIFPDDGEHVLELHRRRPAVQDLHGVDVLLGQEVVERANVLPHLDEAAAVVRAQLEQLVRGPLVAGVALLLVVGVILGHIRRVQRAPIVQADAGHGEGRSAESGSMK